MITIFTDGSARGNPGPGGWGAIVITDESVTEMGGRESHTTNNRMELMAVISALELTLDEREIILYTDSAYVVNGITRWVIGWKKNKWKTSQKEDVLNKDLWERLDEARKHKTIDWRLIKGHSGTAGNERCDIIATSFADKAPVVLYSGSRERYGIDVSIKEPKDSKSKTKSKSKAYSYISMVDGAIEVHKTWEECKKRVHGINAKYKKSTSPADEEEIIKEFTK
ncbi:MAG: ribonuclease HI [Candidatus Zambryskibacteria bacterium RIFOXYD1_FULL_40_13]|nr:MAG: Ribonuclease H [Parcubacteria group bacterium GW2011_GWC1_39_12]KKR19403.1 MAG: Ribonuclease H [Parcubacteria group bacterium GW2011_GWF1_39_37]KKR35215.1 MAG: Ribonuclease H [Parcubacteria group bacterium GW2011_GWC2_40_10]KKR52352.1 MAG: Ribonuclease H [Parcubacteria group bacterium GW2011_GWE1_40_20]KKR64635.1 MAG: Ribonuclease H [Parcubacteria group bacterium GW2011_GWB1_40_5]KKR69416.1 MAG: Ribonuclease H [Parcubacteria group bacterium GW2011_GWF2_40_69]KKR81996.1 MAG: Ribonuclea